LSYFDLQPGGGELDELQAVDPRRIGPYWLEGRLGSGGMGRVYLGRSPGGRNVAIKVIRADLAENPDFRARFAQEVSAARKVSGIFTAPVVDADLDGQVPWLATSYIAGPSLADAVDERGPMPPALVLRLAAGLAEGLAAIHSAGVVHRDLKPANVLLAEDGPRLIDFGISRSLESSSLTRTGMVVGSPGFMSPEQAEGRPVGPESDIFSLGAILTFAATGEGPFGEGSTVALLYRVVTSQPNVQGVPDEIRPAIEHCLAKYPQQRPTAAQLLAQLSIAEVVADPSREGTTRKSALPGRARQAPASAAAAGAAAAGAAAGTALDGTATAGPALHGAATAGPALHGAATAGPALDGAATAGPAYSATQRSPAPSTHGGDAADGRPTLDPSELQYVEAQRHWSGPPPEAQRYQGGPPGADRYQRGPTARPKRRRGWLVALAAVVVLAVGGVAFLAGKAGHHSNSPGSVNAAASSPVASSSAGTSAGASASASADTSSPATQPGAAAMTTLGSYLAQSAAVRPTVQNAITAVQACSESPASAETTIQQAITTRQNILHGLQTLDTSGLPNGTQLVSTLATAMQNSLDADNDYHAWMADLVSSGNSCGTNPNQDTNYVNGGKASDAATTSKNAFLAVWNPMAPQYGQQTYTVTGF
jgi:Protein kinase domain